LSRLHIELLVAILSSNGQFDEKWQKNCENWWPRVDGAEGGGTYNVQFSLWDRMARVSSENYYHCRFVVRTGGENGAGVWHKPFSPPVPFEAGDENLSLLVL